AMISQLLIKEDSRVLELACGTGACTLKIAKIARTGKVVALDFSEGMLRVARENAAFWHFPEPEKVLTGLRMLLTEAGEFAVSLPSWVEGSIEVRETFRAKAKEVLLKHGVSSEEMEKISAQRSRQRSDLPTLFSRCGFVARE